MERRRHPYTKAVKTEAMAKATEDPARTTKLDAALGVLTNDMPRKLTVEARPGLELSPHCTTGLLKMSCVSAFGALCSFPKKKFTNTVVAWKVILGVVAHS